MPCHYVYELVDPRDGEVFYVGKGKGDRMRQHVAAVRCDREPNAAKALRILAILDAGAVVIERKVLESLTEREAFQKERERIALYGLANLTNVSRGETTAMERSRLQAQVASARLKPHDRWMAERGRSEFEIGLANMVRSELAKIALHGQISEIIVGSSGVEFR